VDQGHPEATVDRPAVMAAHLEDTGAHNAAMGVLRVATAVLRGVMVARQEDMEARHPVGTVVVVGNKDMAVEGGVTVGGVTVAIGGRPGVNGVARLEVAGK